MFTSKNNYSNLYIRFDAWKVRRFKPNRSLVEIPMWAIRTQFKSRPKDMSYLIDSKADFFHVLNWRDQRRYMKRSTFELGLSIAELKLETNCLSRTNKNAFSSIESRLLGDKFCCQRLLCWYVIFFRLEYKTSVICHNVNTQNVKIVRRDRPHALASHPCQTFENLLHIEIAPVRRTLSGILHSKTWAMIFFSINIM